MFPELGSQDDRKVRLYRNTIQALFPADTPLILFAGRTRTYLLISGTENPRRKKKNMSIENHLNTCAAGKSLSYLKHCVQNCEEKHRILSCLLFCMVNGIENREDERCIKAGDLLDQASSLVESVRTVFTIALAIAGNYISSATQSPKEETEELSKSVTLVDLQHLLDALSYCLHHTSAIPRKPDCQENPLFSQLVDAMEIAVGNQDTLIERAIDLYSDYPLHRLHMEMRLPCCRARA